MFEQLFSFDQNIDTWKYNHTKKEKTNQSKRLNHVEECAKISDNIYKYNIHTYIYMTLYIYIVWKSQNQVNYNQIIKMNHLYSFIRTLTSSQQTTRPVCNIYYYCSRDSLFGNKRTVLFDHRIVRPERHSVHSLDSYTWQTRLAISISVPPVLCLKLRRDEISEKKKQRQTLIQLANLTWQGNIDGGKDQINLRYV